MDIYLERYINLKDLLKSKSCYLFGPLGVGKDELIRRILPTSTLIFDLSNEKVFSHLNNSLQDLKRIIEAKNISNQVVVINEIQKLPKLISEVVSLSKERGINFLLTASSARKLFRKNVDLRSSEINTAYLHPLTYKEIPNFDLSGYLKHGGMPGILKSKNKVFALEEYLKKYLEIEIKAQSLVRKNEQFMSFIKLSAKLSGRMLKFNFVAQTLNIPASTVREFYYLLNETLIGFLVPAWVKSEKRKAIRTSKFFYSDIGLRNYLCNIDFTEWTEVNSEYKNSFKHFIAMELKAYLTHIRETQSINLELHYWQAKNGQEVDFILNESIAIDVAPTKYVVDKSLRNLKALGQENIFKKLILVSMDPITRTNDGIEIVYFKDFLDNLWSKDTYLHILQETIKGS